MVNPKEFLRRQTSQRTRDITTGAFGTAAAVSVGSRAGMLARGLGRAGRAAIPAAGRSALVGGRLAVFGTRQLAAAATRSRVLRFGIAGAGLTAAGAGIRAAALAPPGTGAGGRADIGAGVFAGRFVSFLTLGQSRRLGTEQEVITKFGIGRQQILSALSALGEVSAFRFQR